MSCDEEDKPCVDWLACNPEDSKCWYSEDDGCTTDA